MAIIGLMSDTHGQATIARHAVALLAKHGAVVLIHLGDVGNQQVIDAMVVDGQSTGSTRQIRLVWGNTDYNSGALAEYAQQLGIVVDHPAGRLMLEDGKILAYTHGHVERQVHLALRQRVDYLCHGHTHVARDQRLGPTRLINPGALCRAPRLTVATLDTDTDKLTFYQVDQP